MDITQVAVVMLFGALMAVAGLALLYARREQAENRIRLFGQEFQISTPALVVFLAGCAIFILPSVMQIQNQTLLSFQWPWQSPGREPTRSVKTDKEEKEPNDQITTANIITEGTTIRGMIATKEDRDVFKFKTLGQGLNTRIILRKPLARGFGATLTVYDSVENRVASGTEFGEDPVSLVFRSNPNSYYYVKVESYGDDPGGPYELLINEE
jgi:hypothetical protein